MQSAISNQFPHLRVLHLLILTLCSLMSLPAIGQTPASAPAFNWIYKTTLTAPSPRESLAMAYDAANEEVVLFGGFAPERSSSELSDTWFWNGSRWTQQHPKTVPPARYGQGMAYDATQSKVIMFGGNVDATGRTFNGLSDTWAWDGTNWTQEHPATIPPALQGAVLAYDGTEGNVVMYGVIPGQNGVSAISETWVWDGNNWTRENPVTSPPAFGDYSMTFDAVHDNVVLLGGVFTGGPLSGQQANYYTWVWDGTNWTEESNGSAAFTVKYSLAVCMAYDAAQGEVVLTGIDGNYLNSPGSWTAVWNGKQWTYENPKTTPGGSIGQAMAYDAAHKEIVMFGGATSHSHFPENGTYVWAKP